MKTIITLAAALLLALGVVAIVTLWQAGKFNSLTASAVDGDPVLVGAGEIAVCNNRPTEETAKLIDNIPGIVFTAGDNVSNTGTLADYVNCYGPTWGRFKERTHPVPGQNEYASTGATPYYQYFGTLAGQAGKGYYSYNLGAWHIVALNSEIDAKPGSDQEQWLRTDLAANGAQCTLAYWNRPLFSSGVSGGDVRYTAIWQALYEYGADLVINADDRDYERFAQQTGSGVADPVYGIREFVVGTGGTSLAGLRSKAVNSQVFNSDTFGVLRLTLHSASYDWQFTPIAGRPFSDSGVALCHAAPPHSGEPFEAYVVDSFKRHVSQGWANADVGGLYALGGAADFSTDGSSGIVNMSSADTTRSAFLEHIAALNVDGTFRFRTSKPPSGGGSFVYFIGRRVAPGNQYLGRLRLGPDGTLAIQAVRETEGTATLLGSEVKVPDLDSRKAGYVRLRVRIIGVHPTTILIRAWPDGEIEPTGWQYRVTDGTEVLQREGAVGIRFYLGPGVTNAPVQFALTDFLVTGASLP